MAGTLKSPTPREPGHARLASCGLVLSRTLRGSVLHTLERTPGRVRPGDRKYAVTARAAQVQGMLSQRRSSPTARAYAIGCAPDKRRLSGLPRPPNGGPHLGSES